MDLHYVSTRPLDTTTFGGAGRAARRRPAGEPRNGYRGVGGAVWEQHGAVLTSGDPPKNLLMGGVHI